MAQVEDRFTKTGSTIILKSHHVLSPRRVLTATPTVIRYQMATHIGILPTDILDVVTTQLQDQPRFLRLPHPRTGMCQCYTNRLEGLMATRRPFIIPT